MTTWTVNLKVEANPHYDSYDLDVQIREALALYNIVTVGYSQVVKSRKQGVKS